MLETIRKLNRILTSKEKSTLSIILFGIVLMATIEMAGVVSIMPFMAVVSNPDIIDTNVWLNKIFNLLEFSSNKNFLIFLGFIVLILLILGNLLKAMMTWLTLSYDNKLNFKLSRRLLSQYLSQPYVFFLTRNTAGLSKNILNEVRSVIAGVLSPSIKIISNTLIILLIFSILFIVDPVIALSMIIILGGTYTLIYLSVRRKLSTIGKTQVQANFMKFKSAREALSGIKDLKVLGRENYFLDIFSAHAENHSRNNVLAGSISQIPKFLLEIIAFGGILSIVIFFLNKGNNANETVPLLALYAFSGYRLMPALQELFSNTTTLRYSIASLDILYNDLITKDKFIIEHNNKLDTNNIIPLPFKKSLILKDVTFNYPDTESSAIDYLNIEIKPNTTIGIVGTTGSGKTTAVDIILGLLAPSSGYLVVDDTVIDKSNCARWQVNIGYVPQQIYLTDDTLANNIAFGIPESEINIHAVKKAARTANLEQFIENELPLKYDTVIGERGVRLSGGQRQRIGIARALYRDPSILVMDEATSALDGITETSVMDAIKTLSGEKTIILIAHRLTTVKDCDIIFQLEHGKLVSQGTYDELNKSSDWFNAASNFT